MVEALPEQLLNLFDFGRIAILGSYSKNTPLTRLLPALNPVSDVDARFGAKGHINRCQPPKHFSIHQRPLIVLKVVLRMRHFEASAFGLHLEVANTTWKVTEEKMIVKGLRHPCPGIKSKSCGSVADVCHRRDEMVCRILICELPKPFRIPTPHIGQPLPPHGPAAIPPFNHVDQACLVSSIPIVIGSP